MDCYNQWPMASKRIWSALLFLGFVSSLNGIEPAAASPSFSFGPQGGQNPSDKAAQNTYRTVSVVVIDQSGARIPQAHLEVVDQALRSIDRKTADAAGEAEFLLQSGATYRLSITAAGFRGYVETFELESDIGKTVTLAISIGGCGVCVRPEREPIPLEQITVTADISEQPLVAMPLLSRPVRRAWRWF